MSGGAERKVGVGRPRRRLYGRLADQGKETRIERGRRRLREALGAIGVRVDRHVDIVQALRRPHRQIDRGFIAAGFHGRVFFAMPHEPYE